MDELIYKYLDKSLNEEENEKLNHWLDANEKNRLIFNKLVAFHKNEESKLPELKERIWEDITQKLGVKSIETQGTSIAWGYIYKIAAILVVVTGLIFVLFQVNNDSNQSDQLAINSITKEAPLGSKITTKLPDGSVVTLNAGSTISFAENFDGAIRKVQLSGEGFFDVVRNTKKPFIVQMNGDEVEVLGTSFNIRSYPTENYVAVSVASGRVSYSIPSGDQVFLEPNRMAVYLPEEGSLSTRKVDETQAFGWKDKILSFSDANLETVVAEIERWYGVEIEYNPELSEIGTYSEQFDNPTLIEILHSLSFVYRFNFNIEGKKITLNKSKK